MSDKGPNYEVGGEGYFVLRVVLAGVQVGVGRAGELLSSSEFVAWDLDRSDEEVVKQVDEAIAQAVEGLAEEVSEPGEVLYGVPASWVHEHQLLPTHKQRLKSVASRLELKPMGFVVTSEALVRYLSDREKFPVSGLLIEVGEQMLEVDWVRSGQVQESRAKKREADEVEDLVSLLEEFPSTAGLPLKWWVFNATEKVEELVEKIKRFDWGGRPNLRLDHIPEVEAIGNDECLEAVCGVVDVGGGVSDKVGEEVRRGKEEERGDQGEVELHDKDKGGGFSSEAERDDSEEGRELASVEEVGFVWGGEDSGKLKVQSEKLEFNDKKSLLPRDQKEVVPANAGVGKREDVQREIGQGVGLEGGVGLKGVGKKGGLRLRLPKKLWLVPLVLFLLVGVLGFGYWYLPSAEVTLAIKSTKLEEKVNLRIDPAVKELDFEAGVIPGRVLEVEKAVERTGGVSGEKTVGEKAKGKVKIFNDTSSVQLLEAGTELVSAAGLEFSLDEEVKVASKSVDPEATPPYKPGEAEVGVTAVEIGADYNLASGASFSVANFTQSSLIGRSMEDFTGGSARQVMAVSEDDREELLSDAKKGLFEDGKSELRGKVSGDTEELVEESIQMTNLSSIFNHEAGDEAEELRLSLEGKVEGVVFSKGSFDDWVNRIVESRIPEGMALLGEKEVVFEEAVVRDESGVEHEVLIRANLAPKIDTEEVKIRIRGRTPQAVREYLSGLPGGPEVRLVFRPALPNDFVRFPFRVERISVNLEERG